MLNSATMNGSDMEQVASTTARELVGSEIEDTFGLLDCPLHISRGVGETGTRYQVSFGREPFSSKEFIDFFNTVSPAHRQMPVAIAGDWVYGTAPLANTSLAIGHSKVPAWATFTERAEEYTALARHADQGESGYHSSIVDFDEWKATLPDPKTFDFVEKTVKATVTAELEGVKAETPIGLPGRVNLDTIRKFADNPPRLFLKRMQEIGFTGGDELLKTLVAIKDPKYETHDTKMVIRNFSKWPFAERQTIQAQAVEILCGIDNAPTEKLIELLSSLRIRQLSRFAILNCIGSDGEQGYVDARDIRSSLGIPLDYRDLDGAFDEDSGNQNYRIPTTRISVWERLYGGGYQQTFKWFRSKPIKLREILATPILDWHVDDETDDRDFSDEISVSQYENELPTTDIKDGVFGLVTVQYIDNEVELPSSMKLKVQDKSRTQLMGAAQLPLLALMYKKQIVGRSRLLAAAQKLAE